MPPARGSAGTAATCESHSSGVTCSLGWFLPSSRWRLGRACGALFDCCSGGAEPAERVLKLCSLRLRVRILSLTDLVEGLLRGRYFPIKVAEERVIPFERGPYGGQTAASGTIFAAARPTRAHGSALIRWCNRPLQLILLGVRCQA